MNRAKFVYKYTSLLNKRTIMSRQDMEMYLVWMGYDLLELCEMGDWDLEDLYVSEMKARIA